MNQRRQFQRKLYGVSPLSIVIFHRKTMPQTKTAIGSRSAMDCTVTRDGFRSLPSIKYTQCKAISGWSTISASPVIAEDSFAESSMNHNECKPTSIQIIASSVRCSLTPTEFAKDYQWRSPQGHPAGSRPQAIVILRPRRQGEHSRSILRWNELSKRRLHGCSPWTLKLPSRFTAASKGCCLSSEPSPWYALPPHTRHTSRSCSLQDNRDAEAFLKPVSRMDYPDYYERMACKLWSFFFGAYVLYPTPSPQIVIKHPMDLGTMLKNVKARKYKSKQEFAADLGLIWKNCFKYNSGPVRS